MYNQDHIFMSGIGGIGMSALAQLLHARGAYVTGSDRSHSPTTTLLLQKGIAVEIGQKPENVPVDAVLLVYSAALAETHPERVRARELGIPEVSYFEMLGRVAKDMRTIAVAGTHGKTTTTAMLGKILIDAGVHPSVVVGSLVEEFGGNYVEGKSNILVVEACEYQRHFLHLSPEVLVVTNLEYDHTDYFKNMHDIQDAFRTLMEKTTAAIVTNTQDSNITPLLSGLRVPVIDYLQEPDYELQLLGEFNVMNARAAAAAARTVVPNISDESLCTSLRMFRGTWRRLEYKGKTKQATDVYDDYAHHPTAIRGTLKALRARTRGKLVVLFQPHLFSRTHDLFEDFAASFQDADEILLAPIYAAREEDDGLVSSERLASRIRELGGDARAVTLESIEKEITGRTHKEDIIITMGAGDVYKVADMLVK